MARSGVVGRQRGDRNPRADNRSHRTDFAAWIDERLVRAHVVVPEVRAALGRRTGLTRDDVERTIARIERSNGGPGAIVNALTGLADRNEARAAQSRQSAEVQRAESESRAQEQQRISDEGAEERRIATERLAVLGSDERTRVVERLARKLSPAVIRVVEPSILKAEPGTTATGYLRNEFPAWFEKVS